jgi:hypothetical protein
LKRKKWFSQRSKDLSDQERQFITAGFELRERLEQAEKTDKKRSTRKLPPPRALPMAHFERNDVTTICETVH